MNSVYIIFFYNNILTKIMTYNANKKQKRFWRVEQILSSRLNLTLYPDDLGSTAKRAKGSAFQTVSSLYKVIAPYYLLAILRTGSRTQSILLEEEYRIYQSLAYSIFTLLSQSFLSNRRTVYWLLNNI